MVRIQRVNFCRVPGTQQVLSKWYHVVLSPRPVTYQPHTHSKSHKQSVFTRDPQESRAPTYRLQECGQSWPGCFFLQTSPQLCGISFLLHSGFLTLPKTYRIRELMVLISTVICYPRDFSEVIQYNQTVWNTSEVFIHSINTLSSNKKLNVMLLVKSCTEYDKVGITWKRQTSHFYLQKCHFH